MSEKTKRGGPKTVVGKAIVSSNARKHGGHSRETDVLLNLLATTRRVCGLLTNLRSHL